jgi:hypothetical protein
MSRVWGFLLFDTFRLETLPAYGVLNENAEFREWRNTGAWTYPLGDSDPMNTLTLYDDSLTAVDPKDIALYQTLLSDHALWMIRRGHR